MSKKPYIGLITAVPFEGQLLLKELKDVKKVTPFTVTGRLGKNRIVYAVSGIGIANAAHAATLLIEKFSPCLVIVFGIGGAYPQAGLKIGDIALAEKEIYADTGVEGYDAKAIGIPLLKKGRKKYFNEFPLNKGLVRKVLNLTDQGNIKSGVFLTVSESTGTLRRAKQLKKKYNAICENMEGAAVVHICTRYGVPVLELRGISNIVEDRDTDKWDKKLASENCQKVIIELLKGI
jgi:futalosine hydrolase